MKKYKIIWFFVFTLIFTVIIGGMSSALADVSNPDHSVIVLTAIQMSPTLSLLLVCLLGKNFTVFRQMKWGLDRKKQVWLPVSVLLPAVIVCSSALILSFMGIPYTTSIYGKSISLLILIPLTIVGITGEEIGWRGFMLPAFTEKYPLLPGTIFTGFLWGLWHFGKIQMFGVLGYVLFIFLCIEFSILMAWVFSKTKNSLLPMIAFHFAVNTCSMFVLYDREGIPFYITALGIGGVLCGIVVLANKSVFSVRRNYGKIN